MYDGRRYRFTVGRDLKSAKERLAVFRMEVDSGWRPGEQRKETWKIVVAARLRLRQAGAAKKRGIPFHLTAGQVYALLKDAEFRCSISGIALSKHEIGLRGVVDPWGPSLDRIDNRIGYVLDNVRVVCVVANMAMNAFGFDTLLRLAKGVVRNARGAVPESVANPYTAEGTEVENVITLQ